MRRFLKLLAAIAMLVLIGVMLRVLVPAGAADNAPGKPDPSRQTAASPPSAPDGANSAGGKQNTAVPVMATEATSKDVRIIVRGIGNVVALNGVAVKSRVDGNIVKILYTEGQAVHVGDPLIQIDPRPYQAQLDQASGNAGKDQANLDNARRDLARLAPLMQDQLAATRQQYDTQQALVTQLEAALKADQAVVESARLNLDYATIRSPIDGVVGLQLVAIGNLVQASAAQTLVTVNQVQPIGVVFTVPERDLDRVRQVAAKQKIGVLAYNADDDRELAQGIVTVINNQVDQATGTITLKALFDNKDAALWPGEFVNAHLVLETVRNGVTIPPGAVQMGPSGSFVYVIKPDQTVAVQAVTVTQVEADAALIGKGLAVGDRIVASGQAGLSPGVKVAVQQGAPGQMNAQEPEIGPEGVGSTGVNTAPSGAGQINPR